MKDKFRYVNEIKFKDRTYAIFDNDGYKVFLRKLETEDFDESTDIGKSIKSTKLVYTDLDEFKELNRIFNHKLKLINAMIEESKSEDEDEEQGNDLEEHLEVDLEKGKLYRFPIRVYNNGEFISLAQAIEETGFGIARKQNEMDIDEENAIIEETFDNEEELFNSKKIEVEQTTNGEYRIKSIKANPKYADSVFIEDIQEFSKISGINSPSYDDLREAVVDNQGIKDKFKNVILEGLNNLEKDRFNIDFSVLYYNLRRLKVIEMDFGIISFITGNKATIATFNPTDGQIIVKFEKWEDISPERLQEIKYTFLHEVLGHGSTEAYVENNFRSISYSLITPIEDTEGQLATVDIINYGDAFREAVADLIALKAVDGGKEILTYKPFFMELEILLKVLDYSEEDLIDKGVWGLKDEMIKAGISNPEKYIDKADTSKMSIATSYAVSEKYDLQGDIIEMLNQIIDNRIQNGISREDAILDIVNILDNEITFDYEDAFDNIIQPISTANIKKGIINEIEEKA